MTRWRRSLALVVLALVTATASACSKQLVVPNWDPAAFQQLGTLQFLTVGPEEGPHWSTVWLVVLDGQVYIRLGSRAADRMRKNTTAPHVGVRIGGREYERVRADEMPAMAARVAAAMGEKYTSDLLIRHFAHPLTMRLAPEAAGGS
jgi:hypothetical protein